MRSRSTLRPISAAGRFKIHPDQLLPLGVEGAGELPSARANRCSGGATTVSALDRADDRASHLMPGARAKSPGKGSAGGQRGTPSSRMNPGSTMETSDRALVVRSRST
jgi:hypothetical protein